MIWEKIKRSSIHFLRHPLRTVQGLVFTPNRLRTFFSREHFDELPGCQHPIIEESLVLNAVHGITVLDTGCGRGRWGFLLSRRGFKVCGVDVTSDYLAEASVCGYNRLLKRDFEYDCLLDDFGPRSFDTALVVEVLEHLTKRTGFRLLTDLMVIARLRVVVTTPEGFYPFKGDNWTETHKSGWTRENLEGLGFKMTVHKGRLYNYFLAVYDKEVDS